MRLQAESQRGRSLKRMYFQTASCHRERKRILDGGTQRAIMHTKCYIRPERQVHETTADKSVLDIDSIERMGHDDSFFQDTVMISARPFPRDLKRPGGNQAVQAKLPKKTVAVTLDMAVLKLSSPQ